MNHPATPTALFQQDLLGLDTKEDPVLTDTITTLNTLVLFLREAIILQEKTDDLNKKNRILQEDIITTFNKIDDIITQFALRIIEQIPSSKTDGKQTKAFHFSRLTPCISSMLINIISTFIRETALHHFSTKTQPITPQGIKDQMQKEYQAYQIPLGIQYQEKNLGQIALKGIETEEQYFTKAVSRVREYAKAKHSPQKRQQIDFYDGEPIPYHRHIQAVAHEAVHLAHFIDPEFLAVPKEVIQITALLHDIVEDGHVTFEELETYLLRFIHPALVTEIINGVWHLTKLETESKQEYYERMKSAPFWVKIIKMADNKHNFSTLDGKPNLEKMLKNVNKVRGSWETMFTDIEYEYLIQKGILPKNALPRTKALQAAYDIIQATQPVPNAEQHERELYVLFQNEPQSGRKKLNNLLDTFESIDPEYNTVKAKPLRNITPLSPKWETVRNLYYKVFQNVSEYEKEDVSLKHAKNIFFDYYKTKYETMKIRGYFSILEEAEEQKLYIESLKNTQQANKKKNKVLQIAKHVLPPVHSQNIETLLNKSIQSKQWNNLQDMYQQIYIQMESRRGIHPDELLEKLFSENKEEADAAIWQGLFFLLKTYPSDQPGNIALQGAYSLFRVMYIEIREEKGYPRLVEKIRQYNPESWQDYYRSFISVDLGEKPLSPAENAFSPRMIELQLLIEWFNRINNLNITGRDFLDLELGETIDSNSESTPKKDNHIWYLICKENPILTEDEKTHIQTRLSQVKKEDNIDKKRVKGEID